MSNFLTDDPLDASPKCVVIGASGAIGSAVAQLMVAEGFEVIGLSRLRPTDWSGRYIECDLSDPDSVIAVKSLLSSLGVQAVVNAAGIGMSDSISSLDFDTMSRGFTTNVFGPATVVAALAVGMSEGGTIVNVCSNVMSGRPDRNTYASSKAAVAALTRCWALDLAPRRVRVNAVSPGPVESPLFRKRRPVDSDAEREALRRIPLGRLLQPSEVASVVLFLSSAQSGTMTGQILTVDGGETILGTL